MNNNFQDHTPFTYPEPQKQTFDLRNTLNKYLYHWPLFLLTLAITIGAAYYYLKITKPTFEIKASLVIKDEKKTPDQPSALHEIELFGSSKMIENELEIIKSNQLVGQIVKDLGLWLRYQKKDGYFYYDLYKDSPIKFLLVKPNEIKTDVQINIVLKDKNSFYVKDANGKRSELLYNKVYTSAVGSWKIEQNPAIKNYGDSVIRIIVSNPENTTLQYQSLLSASLINKLGTAVVLSIDDKVPSRGKDVLNQLIYQYNLSSVVEKNKDTKTTLSFLDQKLDSLKGELSFAEKGIESFKSSKGLTDISLQSQVSLENLQANDSKLNEANIQLETINRIDDYVNAAQNSNKVPTANGIEDPGLVSLIDKLSKLQLSYEELAANTPETSPEFEPINRQIKSTKQNIKETVRNIRITLQSKRNKLQGYNSNYESSIRSIPSQERQFIDIKRQQSSKESLYTYYLQKREELTANYAATLKNEQVVDQAFVGPVKSPVKNLTYAVALILGIALPAGLIFTRNSFKNSIVDLAEIKANVKVPVLGELSLEDAQVSNNSNQQSLVQEQFRALRTKLYYTFGDKKNGRVTLLTSSVAGEGKSYVSRNLAIALASLERKTIILEMDLRRPKIAETFNLQPDHAGISEFLMGTSTLSDVIQPSDIFENLHIISSGKIVENPSELLERKQLFNLLDALRREYDDIIIDSPPVHLVSDAMIISRHADLTLYIIRQGFTNKVELNFLNELHQNKQLDNINIIFNGIKRLKYGYGYKYDNTYYQKNKTTTIFSPFKDFRNRF